MWETIAAGNPALWNEFKANDIDAMIDELVQYKKTHYPDDRRRILTCGIPDGTIRVEWLNAAAPGVDSKWEMRLYGLVRTGKQEEARRFLEETRRKTRNEASRRVLEIAAELGMKQLRRRGMLMVNSIWPDSNGGDAPLPTPNVVVARSGTPMHKLSPKAVKGILVNPIYTGVGPCPSSRTTTVHALGNLLDRGAGRVDDTLGCVWASKVCPHVVIMNPRAFVAIAVARVVGSSLLTGPAASRTDVRETSVA